MRKIICSICIPLFLVVIISSAAYAWPDGKKEGFLLGLHGGYALSTIERKEYNDIEGSGFHIGPYIGAGVSQQVFLSFRVRYNQTSSDNSDAEYYITMMGADIMLFPKPDMGLFLNAGVGRAIAASKSTGEPPWGVIFYGGLGSLITENIFLSADYSAGSFDNDMSSSTVSFSIGALWY